MKFNRGDLVRTENGNIAVVIEVTGGAAPYRLKDLPGGYTEGFLTLIKEKNMYKVGAELTNDCEWDDDLTVIAVMEHEDITVYTTVDQDGDYAAYTETELNKADYKLVGATVELTLSEVAKKFGVKVEDLRIKE